MNINQLLNQSSRIPGSDELEEVKGHELEHLYQICKDIQLENHEKETKIIIFNGLLSPSSDITCSSDQKNCHLCLSVFKNNNALRRHLRSVHVEAEPCPYCKKMMKTQGRPDNNRKHLLRCIGFQSITTGMDPMKKHEMLQYSVKELTIGRGYLLNKSK